MKAAKIITLIAFILDSLLTIYLGLSFFKLIPLYQEFLGTEKTIFPLLSIFILVIFSIGSLIYFLYLSNKERKDERVKLALLISILLLLAPFILSFLATILAIIPLYNLQGTL